MFSHENYPYKRYSWIRVTLFGLLIAVVISLVIDILKYKPCSDNINNISLNSSNYPQDLESYRKQYLKHLSNATYLDYTGAGVYHDLDIEKFRRSIIYDQNTSMNLRNELLQFLGTDSSKYTVVFCASATQALKIIGEYYPWTSKHKYIYTKYNHNSVLGIRRYAVAAGGKFEVRDASNEFLPDPNAIYAAPLEDNFAGTKINEIEMHRLTHTPDLTVIADTAAYLPTNQMNLTEYPFAAVVLSFYKIIGFPNYGALVVRNDFAKKLEQKWRLLAPTDNINDIYLYHQEQNNILEDYEVPKEMLIAAHHGLQTFTGIGIKNINNHVWKLTRKLFNAIDRFKHSNGIKAAEIYGNHNENNPDIQGGIVAFNMKHYNGSYIGYARVVKDASSHNFHLRGGCHCNPGACFTSVKLTEDRVSAYYDKKTTCGDNNDIVDGIPLGSVRASLGWASTEEDVDRFVSWLESTYVVKNH